MTENRPTDSGGDLKTSLCPIPEMRNDLPKRKGPKGCYYCRFIKFCRSLYWPFCHNAAIWSLRTNVVEGEITMRQIVLVD